MKLAELSTPTVLIDLEVARKNIAHFQAYANEHELKVRPHIKTHKLPRIAEMQLEAGATGITCLKVSEAEADGSVRALHPLAVLSPIRSGSSTCSATSMNGSRIAGMTAARVHFGASLVVSLQLRQWQLGEVRVDGLCDLVRLWQVRIFLPQAPDRALVNRTPFFGFGHPASISRALWRCVRSGGVRHEYPVCENE
jgi:hypothetical protein